MLNEMARVELLSEMFVWAYERSCRRYMAIRETFAEADPAHENYSGTPSGTSQDTEFLKQPNR